VNLERAMLESKPQSLLDTNRQIQSIEGKYTRHRYENTTQNNNHLKAFGISVAPVLPRVSRVIYFVFLASLKHSAMKS